MMNGEIVGAVTGGQAVVVIALLIVAGYAVRRLRRHP